MRSIIFQLFLVMVLISSPLLSATVSAQQQTEDQAGPQVEEVDHQFQFSQVIVDVKSKSLTEFVVVAENRGDEPARLLVQGLDGPQSRDIVVIRQQETRQFNITPASPPGYPIYAAASIQEFIPGEDIEGEADVSDAYFTIQFQLIEITDAPPVPHESYIVFLGGLVVIISTASGFLVNSRNTRVAVPKNRSLDSAFRDSPKYNWSEDDPAVLKLAIFVKDWIKAWGLIVVSAVIMVWGVLRFLGAEFSGTYTLDFFFFQMNVVIPELLENSMVYMMYGEVIFLFPCIIAGVYLARTKWVELSDVNPRNGDNFLYWLSPQRFAELTVITNVRKFNANAEQRDETITYEAPKSWLYDINTDTRRDSFEVMSYDVDNNICEVSWSGELKKLNPSKIRSNQRMINYVFETSMWAIDQYHKLKDFFVVMVQEEANYLKARQQAIIEEAEMPEYGSTRDRVEQGLEKRNEANILEDNQLGKAERLQEMRPEGEELLDEGEDEDLTTREGGDTDGQ